MKSLRFYGHPAFPRVRCMFVCVACASIIVYIGPQQAREVASFQGLAQLMGA